MYVCMYGRYGHRSSAANFQFTDHASFHRKTLLQFEVNEFEKKHYEKLHAMLDRFSFVRSLQVC